MNDQVEDQNSEEEVAANQPLTSITVYQTAPNGVFLYADVAHELPLQRGSFNVPYGAYTDAPPAVPEGSVARRVGDEWVVVEDNRSATLYEVESGQPYQLGTAVDVDSESVTYDGLGPIPAWLTTEPPAIPEGDGEPEET